MPDIRVRAYRNPWPHSVPNDDLVAILFYIANERAKSVEERYSEGLYERNSLAIAFLDPSAALTTPSIDALLASISIGSEGDRLTTNAVAKAVQHRDHGRLAGTGTYVDLTQSRDGDFTYGLSTQVDGTTAAGSGLSELQDAYEAGMAAVTLNLLIRQTRKFWFEGHKDRPRWFCNTDEPGQIYTDMANATPAIYDGRMP